MRLGHCQVALLVPDVSLLHSSNYSKTILFEQNEMFFIRYKYSHLAVFLQRKRVICFEVRVIIKAVKCSEDSALDNSASVPP